MQKVLKKIIITGSNKGIGYGIVQNLAQKQGWRIIMACRSLQLAEKSRQQLASRFPNASIQVQQLDVSNSQSIKNFIQTIKNKYQNIDVVLNNAGMAFKGNAFDSQVVRITFATNFYGTNQFTDAILPYINKNGKIINVGSMVGKLSLLKNQHQKQRFANPNLTKQELYKYLNEFQTAVKQDNLVEKGFPKSAYGMSKLGLNLYTKILSKRQDVLSNNIQVYALCPGYVNTDMTSHKGHLTIEQGALTPVYLAQLPFELNQKLQGQFFERSALSSL